MSPIFSFALAKRASNQFQCNDLPLQYFVRKLGFTRFKTGARLLEIMVVVFFLNTHNLKIMNWKSSVTWDVCTAFETTFYFSFSGNPNHDPNTRHCLNGADGKACLCKCPPFYCCWQNVLRAFTLSLCSFPFNYVRPRGRGYIDVASIVIPDTQSLQNRTRSKSSKQQNKKQQVTCNIIVSNPRKLIKQISQLNFSPL